MQGMWAEDAEDLEEESFKPLSKEEAQKFRDTQPQLSVRQVLLWQALAALLLVGVLWLLVGKDAAYAAAYGGMTAWLPAAMLGRGLRSRFASLNAMGAAAAFFVWEMCKLALSFAMLLFATQFALWGGWSLNWLYLLLGLVWVMKSVWLLVWLWSRQKRLVG